ncbi:multidrug efflux RND transporter permease subunit [Ketobacter nezhaii]|uniref:multidrug efflux RND transporter permease subunit n=1 Tax=Ketobacter sp. MCCC 1A13808 TaxID=2602738 RepID=UPI0018DD9DB2|nr:multidrug efflux RND transporter permease subunit [Ketobacter sp. MCCC 1A13808]
MSAFFVDRPVFAWVMAIVIMLAGLLAIRLLPISQYPDIAPPAVIISTSYPGASAQVVENSVTQILEQELKGLDDLMYFSSTSSASGQAEVMLTFQHGTDIDKAQVQVQNSVNQVANRLPQIVQLNGITVSKTLSSFLMIAVFYDDTARRSDTDISDWLSNSIQDSISRIDGVGRVNNFGSPYAMRIWLNPHKLNSYGLNPADVIDAIETQNTEVPVGELGARPSADEQRLNVTVTALSRLKTPEQFRDIVITSREDGAIVRLADVARVELGDESYSSTSRLNGKPASGLAVMLAPGANALDTAAAVKQRIEQMRASFPSGIKVVYPEDSTRFVKLSIQSVIQTLLEAVVLVVLVMFLFLKNWRATLIPAITVPVVLLGTLAVLAALGYSINTLTLFGMVLAIGLLVDDAIVVVENVERNMVQNGLDARDATLLSMKEISSALIGIALVLGAVFLPMAFFPGSVGVIYRQFSVTLVTAMGLSVVVALSLTPALTALLLKPGQRHNSPSAGDAATCPRGQRYQSILHHILKRPLRFGVIYGVLAVAVLWGYQRLPTAFFPQDDQGTVMVQFMLPSGATYARTAQVVEKIEQYFMEEEAGNMDAIYTLSGFSFNGSGQNAGMAFVALKDWSLREGEENSASAIANRATAALGGIREADIFSNILPPIEGLGNTNGFEFWLQDTGVLGHDKLVEASLRLADQAGQSDAVLFAHPNGTEKKPQMRINIDQVKASALGLNLSDVNSTLSTAWGGLYVNDFVHHGRVKKVFVQADAEFRAAPEDLDYWFVRGGENSMTSFSSFADIQWEAESPQLFRFNGFPAIQLFGDAAPAVSSGDAMAEMERLAGTMPDTGFEWSGLSYQDKLSRGQAPMLYAVSILFVFLCLAALYESWIIPLAVLMVIPLGILGAVLAVSLRGIHNDIYFQVGVLTTIGLSAKNAILIVEFAQAAVRSGSTPAIAVIEGARQRVRPILMTSLAFGAGVLPLAIASGPGSAGQNAIGISVLGGVISATLLALFFVPLFYWILYTIRNRFTRSSVANERASVPDLA